MTHKTVSKQICDKHLFYKSRIYDSLNPVVINIMKAQPSKVLEITVRKTFLRRQRIRIHMEGSVTTRSLLYSVRSLVGIAL